MLAKVENFFKNRYQFGIFSVRSFLKLEMLNFKEQLPLNTKHLIKKL